MIMRIIFKNLFYLLINTALNQHNTLSIFLKLIICLAYSVLYNANVLMYNPPVCISPVFYDSSSPSQYSHKTNICSHRQFSG